MIPHIIHYCWFGKNEKPELVCRCIESWKKYFPDYKIIEWNEDNYDIKSIPYITEAYERRKWAFVSDYVRFDILYKYGGIYFDTDVEVLKKFENDFFENDAFTGMESTNEVAPGLVFGCIPRHPFLEKILKEYECAHFIIDGKETPITVNNRVTDMMVKDGYSIVGEKQIIDDVCIYPSEFFCGFDLDVFEPDITENTYSLHHYASSWAYGSFKFKRAIQKMIKKIVGVENYRTLLRLVRRLR